MPSSNRLVLAAALALLAGGAGAQQPSPAAAPDAPPPPSNRYDAVGYAAVTSDDERVAAAHSTLPVGSVAEVTALDSGRTVLVPITAHATGPRELELSRGAAVQLGLGTVATAPVRVRLASPGPADLAALSAGRPAAPRPDTPPVLLKPLRAMLAAKPRPAVPPRRGKVARSAERASAAPKPTLPARSSGSGYYVQVAAIANAARAHSLASTLGGQAIAAGALYRIRLGPFADAAAAKAARDGAARHGYGDARIVRED